MKTKRHIFILLVGLIGLMAVGARPPTCNAASKSDARIFVLMVWDGLRPDMVDSQDTPNLVGLAHEGALLQHHHSVFPTVTMVDAAALATGAYPDAAGILGDRMYFAPVLGSNAAQSIPRLGKTVDAPLDLESSHSLAALNSNDGFNGYLLGVEALAQQVERAGGYVAIVGKQGPTFLFDDQAERRSSGPDYLFIADDLASPGFSAAELARKPLMRLGDLNSIADRDQWFTRIVIGKALPAARAAVMKGRGALIVLWQHNPDLVQHAAGLGTQPALNSLRQCDANLAAVRTAIGKLGVARRTDLMVVSDHGFATIRVAVSLSALLVNAGIKRSADSKEIVVARNGGEDLVYLSRSEFASEEARRAMLARIVDFAAAQEWCGPIFSVKAAAGGVETNRQNHLGWIPGTFAEEVLRLHNATRSPDLIISFRELADVDNRGLTGPANPAFSLGAHGQIAAKNVSFRLVRPVPGVVYADARSFSTGLGMHGAAGVRELHAFCAAAGPDFRRHFIDSDPTGNADVAPTIRKILDQSAPEGASGRVIEEALTRASHQTDSPREQTLTSYLVLQGQEVVSRLRLTRFEGEDYLEDSSVTRNSLGGSP